VVGIMLTSFGTFWGGEGIGIQWWHEDIFLPILIVFYLAVTGILVLWLRSYAEPSRKSVPSGEQARKQEVIG